MLEDLVVMSAMGRHGKGICFLKRSDVACTMGFQETQGGLARAILRVLACHLALDPLGSQMRAGPDAMPLTLRKLGLCKII